jgi:hypothetical protein
MIDFKLSGKIINKKERQFLNSLGLKWCGRCKTAKSNDQFFKNTTRCKDCSSDLYQSWKERNPSHLPSWRKANYDKRTEYNKNWKLNNRDKYLKRRSLWKKKKRMSDPAWYLMEKIRSAISRLKKNELNKKTLSYIGVDTIEDFIKEMGEKTENKNWLIENYHIDHIWQLNWFSEALKNPSDELLMTINNKANLRPLPAKENCCRPPFDFQPLNINDFERYSPYLNKDIRDKIQNFFNFKTANASSSPHSS